MRVTRFVPDFGGDSLYRLMQPLRSSRYFTTKYGSAYAVYVLEKKKIITRMPTTKKHGKIFFTITGELPDQEYYDRVEEEVFSLTCFDLLVEVYKDLVLLSKRSLREGAAILTVCKGQEGVAVREADMVYLESLAEAVKEHMIAHEDLDKVRTEYHPHPGLLYPTRGWPTRKLILRGCLERVGLVAAHFEGLEELQEDLRAYTEAWWQGGRNATEN